MPEIYEGFLSSEAEEKSAGERGRRKKKLFIYFCLFKTGFHYAVQNDHELAL